MTVYPDKQADKYFSSLVKDKNVVIVGPAAYLEGSDLGKSIDDHDVVVRINRAIETTKTHSKDVGARTDILYSCLLETHRNAGILDFNFIKESGVKLICAPGFNKNTYDPSFSYGTHGSISQKTWNKIKTANYPVRVASKSVDDLLKKETQTRPNTGFIAIFDILEFKPKSLTIHGFTFYLDGFIKGSKSGVEKEKDCTEEEFALMALNSKRHKQENIWRFAKATLPNNPLVVLDDVMKKILSLESFSREEYKK